MKKFVVILIAIISITAFSLTVYYGFKHARGVPVPIEQPTSILLKSLFVDKGIDFAKGIDAEFWATLPSQDIKLLYQVMVLPWPKVVTPSVTVKSFHNKKDIYFYMNWKDETENRTLGTGKFSDACAIMFPFDKDPQMPTLMMGFLGKANIWQWRGSQDREYWHKETAETKAYSDFYYPFEEEELFPVSKEAYQSAANDLMAIRVGTITQKERQDVQGRGFWKNGAWHVVFKRSLKAFDPEIDAVFVNAQKRLCAFAVWNGENGDRGSRKSISDWVELEVE